ncbi:hypothetical protein [Lelliottia wanjuensis]|uniref:Uncharacterized protein n=1 Tax=Lelliottia wanjuensis TaxID=3050585 RepID=A0AAP4LCA5_9ENTR|nr:MULTISPECIES: hypothetical protein [unclassified Lelliottia]MDK9365386.1 hypothetical protein [Lelliottia sp. V106_12]MDK9617919.1 hypothetical protein [Lelliottia sp. V106_9]
MKLIDTLIDQLPDNGGWPKYVDAAISIFGVAWSIPPWGCHPMAYRMSTHEIVTFEQYESALTASKPEWDGEGLPPVGCECEYKDKNTDKWLPVIIRYSSNDVVVLAGTSEMFPGEFIEIARDVVVDSPQFRPIRSEADKKRGDGILALARVDGLAAPFEYGSKMSDGSLIGSFWYELYDAIAAGKIPGIRIE